MQVRLGLLIGAAAGILLAQQPKGVIFRFGLRRKTKLGWAAEPMPGGAFASTSDGACCLGAIAGRSSVTRIDQIGAGVCDGEASWAGRSLSIGPGYLATKMEASKED